MTTLELASKIVAAVRKADKQAGWVPPHHHCSAEAAIFDALHKNNAWFCRSTEDTVDEPYDNVIPTEVSRMFSANTPLRLHGCNGKTAKDNEGNRRRVLLLTFMAQPFTPDMAADLNVKGRIFSSSTGEPLKEIQAITLKIAVPPQKLSIGPAPDVAPSVVVEICEVQAFLKVAADREGPVYNAYFGVELDYPSANDLLWLFHHVTEQVFVTLEPTQGDLLAKDGTTTAKLGGKKKRAEQPALDDTPLDETEGDEPPAGDG